MITGDQLRGVMEIDLEAIKERERKATKGPWVCNEYSFSWFIFQRDGPFNGEGVGIALMDGAVETRAIDGDFIAHARTDIPTMVEEIVLLRGQVTKLREALTGIHDHMTDEPEHFTGCDVCTKACIDRAFVVLEETKS